MNNGIHKEYTIHATRKNRTDLTLSITAYLAAAILYFYSVGVDGVKYVSIMQFLALAMLVIGIYVNQRYTWTNFIYALKPDESNNDAENVGYSFYVYRIQGKKSVCLAKIPCRDCTGIVKRQHGEKKPAALKADKDTARYSFLQTMMPNVYHTAVFRADGGVAHISFEPDEVFVSILSSFINNSEANATEKE